MDIRKAYYMSTGHIDGYYPRLGQGSELQSFENFTANVVLQRIRLRAVGDKQDIDILDCYLMLLKRVVSERINEYFETRRISKGTIDGIDKILFKCCPCENIYKKYSEKTGEQANLASLQNFFCTLFDEKDIDASIKVMCKALNESNNIIAANTIMELHSDPTKTFSFESLGDFNFGLECAELWLSIDTKYRIAYTDETENYSAELERELNEVATSKTKVAPPTDRLESIKKFKNQTKDIFKNIVGQRDQLSRIIKLLYNAELGLNNGGQGPKASMLLTGPTGVGKTETAYAISKALYGKDPFVVDLSVYHGEHQLSTLIGAPPGYVGYKDKPDLLSYIEKNAKTGGVLLFDEFDKTNEKVRNIFMNMLDKGEIQSAGGTNYSVKNFIIILTSNITEKIQGKIGFLGMDKEPQDVRNTIANTKVGNFPPELIARIDEVITYENLSLKDKIELARRKMNSICDTIKKSNEYLDINITYNDAVLTEIVKGANESMGIRELFRAVKKMATSKLVEYIMENDNFTSLDVYIDSLTNVVITKRAPTKRVGVDKPTPPLPLAPTTPPTNPTRLSADDIAFRS